MYKAGPDFVDAVSIITQDSFAALAGAVEAFTQLEAVKLVLLAVQHSRLSP